MKIITNQERELILDLTGEGIIRLPAGVLEKDILITEVLQYLSLTNNFDIELIFCGGTSLSKAYGIIDRMSEDLDFKSILPSGLSRSSRRKLLEKFREKLTFDIESLGFEVPKEQIVVRDEGNSLLMNLIYQSCFDSVVSLRPEVKLEIHVRSPALATQKCSITSIVNETLRVQEKPFTIKCLDPAETLAEKILSFLRKNSCAMANPMSYVLDDQLIRHIYDVSLIYRKNPNILDTLPLGIFKQIVTADVVQYGDQHKAFVENPRKELINALDTFSHSTTAKDLYEKFVNSLVYGADPISFDEARLIFIGLAKQLINREL
jgi:hypothetical protein